MGWRPVIKKKIICPELNNMDSFSSCLNRFESATEQKSIDSHSGDLAKPFVDVQD